MAPVVPLDSTVPAELSQLEAALLADDGVVLADHMQGGLDGKIEVSSEQRANRREAATDRFLEWEPLLEIWDLGRWSEAAHDDADWRREMSHRAGLEETRRDPHLKGLMRFPEAKAGCREGFSMTAASMAGERRTR